jgi:uncharacterized DUF497 family protein
MNSQYADNKLAVNLMKDGVDIDGPRFVFFIDDRLVLQTDEYDEIRKIDIPDRKKGMTIIDLDGIRKEYPYGFGFF